MLTGTSAALAVVFVHSIAVTYFIGTSRWCKEVTETYQLDASSAANEHSAETQDVSLVPAGDAGSRGSCRPRGCVGPRCCGQSVPPPGPTPTWLPLLRVWR